jgi:hypothetical protein
MHWIDPEYLPETTGTFERFIANPDGALDGLVLRNGGRSVLVHFPPHMQAAIEPAVHPGDEIRIRGVRPRGADVIAAVSVITPDGRSILDHGPDRGKEPERDRKKAEDRNDSRTELTGRVRSSLFGPKGELRGALLDDGTVVRIGAKEAKRFAALLAPGATLAVRGAALRSKHGLIVAAKEIGEDMSKLVPAKSPKPKDQKATEDSGPTRSRPHHP